MKVHAVVCDLNGNVLDDRMVGHVFRIENGFIERFDIRDSNLPASGVTPPFWFLGYYGDPLDVLSLAFRKLTWD